MGRAVAHGLITLERFHSDTWKVVYQQREYTEGLHEIRSGGE